ACNAARTARLQRGPHAALLQLGAESVAAGVDSTVIAAAITARLRHPAGPTHRRRDLPDGAGHLEFVPRRAFRPAGRPRRRLPFALDHQTADAVPDHPAAAAVGAQGPALALHRLVGAVDGESTDSIISDGADVAHRLVCPDVELLQLHAGA